MSRNEKILQAIANGESLENYRPQSRNEEILKRICCGESCDDFKPRSRIEYLLVELSKCSGGNSGGSSGGGEGVDIPSVTVEQWDGSYEEIKSGFTLTLNCSTAVINNGYNLYSLDDGATWNQFTSETMILENVTQIKFSETANSLTHLKVGTIDGSSDIADILGYESDNITLTADTTWYVWSKIEVGGAD